MKYRYIQVNTIFYTNS